MAESNSDHPVISVLPASIEKRKDAIPDPPGLINLQLVARELIAKGVHGILNFGGML